MKNFETCESCHYFDPSMHQHDPRTKSAGICKLYYEVTFRNDKCKQHFDIKNAPDWNEITRLTNSNNSEQITLEL